MPRPILYSYQRFSTKEQTDGDSLRRQTEMARRYAEENGYDLDTSLELQDLGVSGFKGANRTKGRLGDFLRMVELGEIARGSALFIEALDRYSRSHPLEALLELFQRLISHGITVITGADGQVYDKKSFEGLNGLMTGIRMLLALGVANQESVQKSARLRAACEAKRRDAHEKGAIYRKRGPFWVTFDESQNAFVLNDNAELVREIFEMYISGKGGKQIANSLNRRGIKSARGKCWQPASVMRLIKDRKVVGEFQLSRTSDGRHTDLIAVGPALKNYYPSCVSNRVFLEANDILNKRPKGCGKTSTEYIDLFERIIFCGNSGIELKKERYGLDRSRYYVRYENGLKDGFTGWKCHDVEQCFFYLCNDFNFESISCYSEPKSNGVASDDLKIEIERLRNTEANLINAIKIGGEIEKLVIELRNVSEEIEKLNSDLGKIDSTSNFYGDTIINKKGARYYYDLLLKRNESEENRLILRKIIREEVERVLLFPNGIETELFLGEEFRHLKGVTLPTIGIIRKNVKDSSFMSFDRRCGNPSPISLTNASSIDRISNRGKLNLDYANKLKAVE